MIRFEPDTWVDAVMRPVAMAAPNGGVYTEIVAPDFRFVFVLVLLILAIALRRGRLAGTPAVLTLLAFCAVAFVPWMVTSGNGRYFMAVLLLAGPLCAALLWQLPVTRALRLTLLTVMIGLQLFLIRENAPWDSWGLKPWKDGPAFAVDVPDDLRARPVTYITLSNISYSIIAPQFNPGSRWINLTTQRGDGDESADGRRTRAFLAGSGETYMLFPSNPGEVVRQRPPAELVAALDEMLGGYKLGLRAGVPCRFLHSDGLTDMGLHRTDPPVTTRDGRRGFWLCPVERRADEPRHERRPAPEIEATFEKLERTCPRMFPPGEARTNLLPVGARRFYPGSDMRLYIFNDGEVAYKYLRALNPVSLGRIQDVLASSFQMDCNQIRGRSGLPWERQI